MRRGELQSRNHCANMGVWKEQSLEAGQRSDPGFVARHPREPQARSFSTPGLRSSL